MKYDHTKPSSFTLEEAQALVGKKARLPLTGRIVGAGESSSGAYVRFRVQERWGFSPGQEIIVDVEALDRVRD